MNEENNSKHKIVFEVMPLPSIKVNKSNYSTLEPSEPRTFIEVPLK